MDDKQLIAVVSTVMESLMQPMLERIASLEGTVQQQGNAFHNDPLPQEVKAVQSLIGELRERVAVCETRSPEPGPAGQPGPPGPIGPDGKPGLRYLGVFVAGKTYDLGDCVTWDGSLWHCHSETTTAKPGDGSKTWQLIVKRGRDGKDLTLERQHHG